MTPKPLLMIIDVQERLFSVMQDQDQLKKRLHQLVTGWSHLDLPIIITEQLPDKLGPSIEAVRVSSNTVVTVPKSSFGCLDEPACSELVSAHSPSRVYVAGIEGHICVVQTVKQLRDQGFPVTVIMDAVSCRTDRDLELSQVAMIQMGAQIASVEMVLFEYLQSADHPQFKSILEVVK